MKSMLKGFYICIRHDPDQRIQIFVRVAPCMWILSLMRITYSSPPCYQLYNSIWLPVVVVVNVLPLRPNDPELKYHEHFYIKVL